MNSFSFSGGESGFGEKSGGTWKRGRDFEREEREAKWNGVFGNSHGGDLYRHCVGNVEVGNKGTELDTTGKNKWILRLRMRMRMRMRIRMRCSCYYY